MSPFRLLPTTSRWSSLPRTRQIVEWALLVKWTRIASSSWGNRLLILCQCITLLLLILLRGILYVGLYCGRLSESPVGTLESFSEFGAHSFLKTFHCSSSYFSSVHRLRRDDDDGPFKCSLSRCWIIIMIVFSQLCNTPTEELNSSRERRIFQSIFFQGCKDKYIPWMCRSVCMVNRSISDCKMYNYVIFIMRPLNKMHAFKNF